MAQSECECERMSITANPNQKITRFMRSFPFHRVHSRVNICTHNDDMYQFGSIAYSIIGSWFMGHQPSYHKIPNMNYNIHKPTSKWSLVNVDGLWMRR